MVFLKQKQMRKNYILVLSVILFFISSCTSNLESEIVMYYPDSIPKLEYFYKYDNDQKYTFKEIRYYPNGVKQSEGSYNKNGQKNGKWHSYFDNGTKWLIENYTDGAKNGKTTEWFKNGKKMYEAFYNNDLPDGTWTLWNENGKKISTITYKDGKLIEE